MWGRHSCLRPTLVGQPSLWGRLSSLRLAFLPAWAPFTPPPFRRTPPTLTQYPLCNRLTLSVFSVLLARRFFSAREDFLCRNRSELPARPQPPRLFGCGYAALCPLLCLFSVFLRVLRDLCGLPFAAETSTAIPVWLHPCRAKVCFFCVLRDLCGLPFAAETSTAIPVWLRLLRAVPSVVSLLRVSPCSP